MKIVDTAEKSVLMLANLLSLKVIHLKEAKIHPIPPKVAKIVQTIVRWGASCYFNYFGMT